MDEHVVDGFQPDRLPVPDLHHPDLHHVAGRIDNVLVLHDDEGALEEPRGELERGPQHGGAGALGADQGARDVESPLRQQLVTVVAGHPPGQLVHRWEAGSDVVRVAVAQVPELGVDLSLAAAVGDDLIEVVLLIHPDPEPRPVVGEHLQRFGVV
jgi:hypothetical protein